MPFLSSLMNFKPGRGFFAVGSKPSTPAAPSLTDGCTTATFTWTAPNNNGLPITLYGYQTSTNNGATWSSETTTASLSFGQNVNNNTSSYKARVRAQNAAGWSDYSSASAGSTAWSYTSYTPASNACSACGTCTCGTTSQTCYQYTRSGCTTTGCQSCTACSSCTSWVDAGIVSCVYATGINGASSGYYSYNYSGGGWIYYTDSGCTNSPGCSGGLVGVNILQYCSASGAYRADASAGDCVPVFGP